MLINPLIVINLPSLLGILLMEQRRHQQRSDRNVKEWSRKRLVGRFISRRLVFELSTRRSCRSMICWVKDYKRVFEWWRDWGCSVWQLWSILAGGTFCWASATYFDLVYSTQYSHSSLFFYGKERFTRQNKIRQEEKHLNIDAYLSQSCPNTIEAG